MTPRRLNWIGRVVVSGLFLSGLNVQGRQATPPIDVTVYVTGAGSVPSLKYLTAKEIAGAIFARIGIRIVWRERAPDTASANLAIHIRIVRQLPAYCSDHALASALPFARGVTVVTVSWDRVHLVAGGSRLEPHLLAYVMAHELGHILQGTDGHAQTGVMQASWDEYDYIAMEKGLLQFTAADVNLIRRGALRPELRERR